jgi:hypothetical protein
MSRKSYGLFLPKIAYIPENSSALWTKGITAFNVSDFANSAEARPIAKALQQSCWWTWTIWMCRNSRVSSWRIHTWPRRILCINSESPHWCRFRTLDCFWTCLTGLPSWCIEERATEKMYVNLSRYDHRVSNFTSCAVARIHHGVDA